MVTNKPGYMQQYRASHPDYVKKGNEQRRQYAKTHPEKTNEYEQTTYRKLKVEVLSHYSNGTPKCAFCGETTLRKLDLDHINEDGKEHRKTVNGLRQLYFWIKRNNFPATFQVLCHRCNIRKSMIFRKKETSSW